MPGGVGGVASRDVPLSRSTSFSMREGEFDRSASWGIALLLCKHRSSSVDLHFSNHDATHWLRYCVKAGMGNTGTLYSFPLPVPGQQRIEQRRLITEVRLLEPIEHRGEIDKIVTGARMPIVPSVSSPRARAATLPARSSMRSSDAFVVCASVIAALSPAPSRRGNIPAAVTERRSSQEGAAESHVRTTAGVEGWLNSAATISGISTRPNRRGSSSLASIKTS